jgi:hypothetical protein
MSKTTYAQLPGLQKAKKILELQEQVNTHHLYATYLLHTFNDLTEFESAHFDDQAAKLQIICEWHGTQAMYLQIELNQLQSPS